MTTYKYTDLTSAVVAVIDSDGISRKSMLASGVPPFEPILPADAPPAGVVISEFTTAIQSSLDDFARTRGYDGILSACSYTGSSVPAFAAEAAQCRSLRDSTWSAAYIILAAVQSGDRAMPTLAEVLLELPTLEWPQ